MMQSLKSRALARIAGAGLALVTGALLAVTGAQAQAPAGKPIMIGFSQSLTGALSPNGKQALLGMEIWKDQTNKAGGLLGRPVELKYYDDKSDPSEVPGIYTKLLDVDKVDLVVSGYASNQIAPAMPVVIRKGKAFVSLFGLDINDKFKYPKYFSIIPTGQDTKGSFTKGFFDIAAAQKPEAADRRPDLRRRRVRAERLRGRAQQRQEARLQDRLRQGLSAAAEDHRFRADRARDQGARAGSGRRLRLSARLGRHRAGGE